MYFIKILKFILRIVSVKLFNLKLIYLSEFFSSLRATILFGKFVKVKYDGQDWIYIWNDSAAVSSNCFYNPCMNYSDLDLFFFKYFPMEGDILINIGVANGSEIPEFSKYVGSKGKVFAIEADPNCCRRLRKLKKILTLKNLTILETAVGETNKNIRFYQDKNEINNRILDDGEDSKNFIEIKQLSFDKLLKLLKLNTIDFVKVNIEGAEMKLLESLNKSNCDILNWCIGCHDFLGEKFKTYENVYAWLKEKNYQVNKYHTEKKIEKWRKYYLYGSKKAL